MKEKHWLRLEEDNGWQVVVPNNDVKPHSTLVLIFPDGSRKADLAGWDCPCKPQVYFRDKLISHNSFDGREKDEK